MERGDSEPSVVRDVLIVGGGIAGLSAAIALGQRGVQVTLVERDPEATGAAIGFQYRPLYALRELGIIERVAQAGSPVFTSEDRKSTPVWGEDGQRQAVPFAELGDDWELPLAISIYRPVLSELMQDAAREHGAELLIGHSYRSLEQDDDGVEVELTTGERRRFDLVVGADGINSGLRDRFFPEVGDPHYTGSMGFRAMLPNAPDHWPTGLHVVNGEVIRTTLLPGGLFYVALGNPMERRRVDQDEARQIMRDVLTQYRGEEAMAEVREALDEDVHVIVAPTEWILVPPPWYRGRVVLVGDAAHATAPTIGSAGGMALEDAVVLAEELSRAEELLRADELEAGLRAYSERRWERAKLVVETSADLVRGQQVHRSGEQWAQIRAMAFQTLKEAY